ncbi:MAG: hypothetical protein K2P76_03090 [Lachnospiraceae bacterium]|nr:hypothetical protein [Lachnospiraceae bacterium]MDE6981830.1 hypothetical protein [Lachnospiraceae bacterium]
MDLNEFKDRLFDVMNDADSLPIQDLVFEDREDLIHINLEDGSRFTVHVMEL